MISPGVMNTPKITYICTIANSYKINKLDHIIANQLDVMKMIVD